MSQATTFAGKAVTATACLASIALVLTTCALYLRGDLEAAKDAALQAAGVLAGTFALLSRTREDPRESGPVEVRADEPLPVVDAGDPH